MGWVREFVSHSGGVVRLCVAWWWSVEGGRGTGGALWVTVSCSPRRRRWRVVRGTLSIISPSEGEMGWVAAV